MHSIERRLTVGLGAVFSGLVLAGALALYLSMRDVLHDQFDAGLRVKALVVITATEQQGGKIDVDFSDRFLREFDDDVATAFFQVWQVGGPSVERSDSLRRRDLPQRFGTMKKPAFWNLRLPSRDRAGRAIGIKFRPRFDEDDEGSGRAAVDAVVVVAAERGDLDELLRQVGGFLGAGGFALLLAAWLAVRVVLRPGLRPLRRLADQAASIDARNLGQRFPEADVPAELQPICERLNALLGRLETSFQRERRFSADLAHELLTPLAELRTLEESAVKWPDTAGPEMFRETLDITLRMEALVLRLLELARAEHGRLAVTLAPVELGTLLREIWSAHESRTRAKSLEITFNGPQSSPLQSDAVVLRVIAGNLIANAVEYTGAGDAVRVEWWVTAAGAQFGFEVTNPAPQLTESDVTQLFDRFWRKDAARTGTEHSGLGLAVAREFARALGGELDAKLRADGVLAVRFACAGKGSRASPV